MRVFLFDAVLNAFYYSQTHLTPCRKGNTSANSVTVQIAFKFEQNKAKNVSLYV